MVILVVEDDRLISLMTCGDLEDAGYEVISAYDADEAVEILGFRDDIRIIFTDIDMPGSMDGLKLAAAVRDRWPPIHIIITSGKHRPTDAMMPKNSVFLPKPYLRLSLLRAMRSFA